MDEIKIKNYSFVDVNFRGRIRARVVARHIKNSYIVIMCCRHERFIIDLPNCYLLLHVIQMHFYVWNSMHTSFTWKLAIVVAQPWWL